MSNINFKTDILPHVLAIAIFCLVTMVFFAPVIFEGKSLPQHDITQWEGGAKELLDYREKTGEEGLWTNSMFGGMPSYLVNTQFSGDLIKQVYIAYGLFLPYPVMIIFVACISFYIMLLCFGVRSWLAIIGGIAFGFTAFSIIGLMAGHNAKIAAVSLMPLVLGGIHLSFHGKRMWGFVLTSMGLAMHLRPNHLQITYYLLLIVLTYAVSLLISAIRKNELMDFVKTGSILVLAAMLAVGANFGRLWTTMEYSKHSTRGKSELVSDTPTQSGLDKGYAFQYSNDIMEPLFLFIPNFFGGSAQENLGSNSSLEAALRKNGASRQQINQQVKKAPAYWGDQPLTAPYYAGAIVVFLFVLGMLVLDQKQKMWLVLIVVFAIVLSWGKNLAWFNYFMFDVFPGYNKFRSVTFTIIIAVFGMILTGLLGLEKIFSSDWNKVLQKKFLIAFAITAGFALLSIIFAGMGGYHGAVDAQLAGFPDWYLEALREDRASLLRSDALRSLIFVTLFAGVIWFTLNKKLSSVVGFALLILLVVVDLFGVSKRFINSDTFIRKSRKSEFSLTEADKMVLQDQDLDYRVLNLLNPFNDAKTSYHHKSLGGYHGAKMGRYQELIENCIAPEQSRVIGALQQGNFNYGNTGVIDMLNTKYFLAGTTGNAVIPNPTANGNAWFVQEIIAVNSANEEIAAMTTLDTKSTAVIDVSKFKLFTQPTAGRGNINLVDYKPNYLKYESNGTSNGFAVFSEIYYKEGWVAKVDGVETDIIRANYVLRALELTAGSHVIEFEFKPRSYEVGNVVMWVSSIAIILLIPLAFFWQFGLVFGKPAID